MSTATGPELNPQPPHAGANAPATTGAPRHAVVLLMILTTTALFVGLFAVLYFRWAGAQEPSSALVVKTTPAFDGAEIVVEGVVLREPYRVRIGDRRGVTSIPFYLDRGSYTLRVLYGEREIHNLDFILEANRMIQVDLSRFEHLLPTTAPADGIGGATTQRSTNR